MAKARWFVFVYRSGCTTFKAVPPISDAFWCKRFGTVIGPFRTKREAEKRAAIEAQRVNQS